MALTLRQNAGIAQWLVHWLAMPGMAVRFCLPAQGECNSDGRVSGLGKEPVTLPGMRVKDKVSATLYGGSTPPIHPILPFSIKVIIQDSGSWDTCSIRVTATMESKPGRVREPPAKRVGLYGLCFDYTALRKNTWRVNLAGSGNRLESELVRKGCVSNTLLSAKLRDGRVVYCAVPWGCGANPPDVRIVLSQPMDSELGGAQVRFESGTLFTGWGSGPPLSASMEG